MVLRTVRQTAHTATILTILTPAHLTATTAQLGLMAASSSASARGMAGAGGTADIGAAVDSTVEAATMDAAAMVHMVEVVTELTVEDMQDEALSAAVP